MNSRTASYRALICALICLLSGCQGGTNTAPATNMPPPDEVAAVPVGQMAGSTDDSGSALSTPNPYVGNPQAIEQGKALFVKMNCAGCHGYDAKGNMGPDLTDTYWRYGGLPVQIYKSIHDGRPMGMPSWGKALPPQEIWKLVAYIESFGGSMPASDYQHAHQGDTANELVSPALPPLAAPTPNPAVPGSAGSKP